MVCKSSNIWILLKERFASLLGTEVRDRREGAGGCEEVQYARSDTNQMLPW